VSHKPHDFANALSTKLASRSRHVAIFAGAGAARACGLPDVATLQGKIVSALAGDKKARLETQLSGRNLEQALSRLRRISALLDGGTDTIDDLDATSASELDAEVCRLIIENLDVSSASLAPMLRLAAWAARADYHRPLEVFTVNYDLLFETAMEQLGVAYFDGFIGALHARFRTDLVEAGPEDETGWLPSFLVRLWKLHGSVNWAWDSDDRTEVTRLGAPVDAGRLAAIYPSDAKYDESRRVPFVVLQDRFRRALQTPESLVLVTGYSWADEHLNEMLFNAAAVRPRSEFIAFSFDDLPDALAERALLLPNLQAVTHGEAILGSVRDGWEPPADSLPDVWVDDKFGLGDFTNLAAFLSRSLPPFGELEKRLAELLSSAAAGGA
jgi:SIR2-like domain